MVGSQISSAGESRARWTSVYYAYHAEGWTHRDGRERKRVRILISTLSRRFGLIHPV